MNDTDLLLWDRAVVFDGDDEWVLGGYKRVLGNSR